VLVVFSRNLASWHCGCNGEGSKVGVEENVLFQRPLLRDSMETVWPKGGVKGVPGFSAYGVVTRSAMDFAEK
jgi:hypothetical protein